MIWFLVVKLRRVLSIKQQSNSFIHLHDEIARKILKLVLSFSLDIYPGGELLDHRVVLFLEF